MILRIAAIAVAFAFAPLSGAMTQPPATPPIEVMLDKLIPDRPSHPSFVDPLELDSSNGAARYLRLAKDLDQDLTRIVGWLDDETMLFRRPPDTADLPEEIQVDIAEVREGLERNRAWIEALVEASEAEVFDFHLATGNRVRRLSAEDARYRYLSVSRHMARILADDAVLRWSQGEQVEAARRVAAILRLGMHFARHNSDLMHHLITQDVLERGLKLTVRMAKEPNIEVPAIEILSDAIENLHAGDAAGIWAAWNRFRLEAAESAADQLHGEEIGEVLVVDMCVQLMIDHAIQSFFRDFLSELAEQPSEFGTAASDFLQKLEAEHPGFRSPTVESAREILARARVLGDELDAAWAEANAKAVMEAAKTEIDADASRLLRALLAAPAHLQEQWLQTERLIDEARHAISERE